MAVRYTVSIIVLVAFFNNATAETVVYKDLATRDEISEDELEGRCYTATGYDDEGRILYSTMFDEYGKPMAVEGIHRIEHRYPETGEPTPAYYGVLGEPVIGPHGYHREEIVYDDEGRILSRRFLGTKGEPVARLDGIHRFKVVYNESGRIFV